MLGGALGRTHGPDGNRADRSQALATIPLTRTVQLTSRAWGVLRSVAAVVLFDGRPPAGLVGPVAVGRPHNIWRSFRYFHKSKARPQCASDMVGRLPHGAGRSLPARSPGRSRVPDGLVLAAQLRILVEHPRRAPLAGHDRRQARYPQPGSPIMWRPDQPH